MDNHEPSAVLSKIKLLIKFVEIDMNACATTGATLKGWTWKLRLTTIIISFLITITLGLTLNTDATFHGINVGVLVKNIAVFLSALLTAVTTWETFGNYQSRSLQESAMLNRLSMLYKEMLLYIHSNDKCSHDKYLDFKHQYDAIHEEYLEERKSLDEKESEAKDEK